jgi:hypothetical protein
MPSAAPKKPVRRAVKQIQTPIAPATGAAPAANDPSRHGLATVTIILLFLTVGCLAAATLVSEKMKTVEINAQTLAAQLDDSRAQNADLAEEVTNFKTLQALEKKVMAPAAVPADTVWDTYASPNLSLQYPDGYAVVKATAAFPALTIKGDKGRIEIFRMKDFPGGDRPLGFEDATVSQTDLDGFIPKEFKSAAPDPANPKIAPYNVWIYYGAGDDATKAVLDQAASTIKVVK